VTTSEGFMNLPNVLGTKKRIVELMNSVASPSARIMLSLFVDHWWGEVTDDLDTVVSTCATDIHYASYGSDWMGPHINFRGVDKARKMYDEMLSAGLLPGGPFEAEKVSFAEWGFHLTADFTGLFPGEIINRYDSTRSKSDLYVVRWPMTVVTPIDVNRKLFLGEVAYVGMPLEIAVAEPNSRASLMDGYGRKPKS
jgi:hypothetical protein